MSVQVQQDHVEEVGRMLADGSRPLTDRFRALFTLRNLGGRAAVDWISKAFEDPSALLKHELAYCLGQMQDPYAIPVLISVLKDKGQEPMVRHEAGEALGAIGSAEVLDVLEEYTKDDSVEVAETCQLSVQRIRWLNSKQSQEENLGNNPYSSVDPAPPAPEMDVSELRTVLLDETVPLFVRYRAMFTLRNRGDQDAVLALAEGLKCSSALFRHEIAYVLGQIQHNACVPQLIEALERKDENPMVRHECAEALGAIAEDACTDILQKYASDQERVVRESCEVALDMLTYENSEQFQYADGLSKVHAEGKIENDV
ncbi:deoxyhypusine hydroxylase-like [Branchiostoma floridae]|uniref:Deoxyhypusine hydroxylase n=1 Tax=Branchiostoma floridae TaxID=7739 RepID=A0A9J7MEB8_BRAFL|nr:deoxyhypusine hydroxylase-like [Branchiostoma floridae]